LGNPLPDVVPGAPECGQQLVFGALDNGWVLEGLVELLLASEENGATFPGLIAESNYVVELKPSELVHALGALVGDVNAYFGHDPDRIGAHGGWLCSRAVGVVPVSVRGPQ